MPSEVRCFLIEPTDQLEVSLRRFVMSSQEQCPAPPRARFPGAMPTALGYHEARVVIATETGSLESERVNVEHIYQSCDEPALPDDDERWPWFCECGYEFQPGDHRQTNRTQLYRRADTGELTTIDAAPAGAMWNATWYVRSFGASFTRHDPSWCLEMKTPAGTWIVDGPANNGPGWERHGIPPNVAAKPSIGIGDRFHGWLGGSNGRQPGVLVIDKP